MREHVRFMDGLRGIAVLMVVLFHGSEQRLLTPELSAPGLSVQLPAPPMQAGAIGVEIFFFISGFALLYPVAQRVFEGRARQTLGEFARRRALKILPSYVIALVVVTLLIPLEVPQGQSLWLHFAAHLFFLHGLWPGAFVSINGPLWTLAIEVQFYLLFPLVARAFEKRPSPTFVAMVAVSVAYRIAIDATGNDRNFFVTNQLPDQLDLFGSGMYAAWTLVKYRRCERSLATQRRWTWLAVAALVLFYGLLGDALRYGAEDSWKWSSDHRDVEAALLFAFAIGTGFGVERWREAFSNRALLFLGTISYNLYLWNKAAFVWYNWHFNGFVAHLPARYGNIVPTAPALALPFAVAIAMTYGIERPILAGGWRTIYRPTLEALRRLPKPFAEGDAFAVAGPAPSAPARRVPFELFASIAAFALPLALFANSIRHVASNPDGSELVAVSYLFGIAHATGYPLFVMLGWVFAHALPGPTVAWRVIALCALAAAASAWFVARIVRGLGGEAWLATAAALVFATGDFVWSHASDASFAPVALVFFAASLERLVRYAATGRTLVLAASALCAGLGASVHPVALVLVPGLVLVAVTRGATSTRRLAALGAALAGVGTGLLPYLSIPMRAAAIAARGGGPMHALGKPPGEALWDTDDPASPAGFLRLVTGADTGGAPAILAGWSAPPGFAALAGNFAHLLSGETGVIALAFAAIGAAVVVRHAPALGAAFVLAGLSPGLIALGLPAANLTAYFVFSLLICAVFLGVAATALVRAYDGARRDVRRRWVAAALAFGALNSLADNDAIRASANDGLQSVVIAVGSHTATNAIVVAPRDQAMFLAEAGYAEKILTDRTVDAGDLDDDLPYVAEWSKRRPVYAVGLPAGYRAKGFRIARLSGEAGASDSVSAVTADPAATAVGSR